MIELVIYNLLLEKFWHQGMCCASSQKGRYPKPEEVPRCDAKGQIKFPTVTLLLLALYSTAATARAACFNVQKICSNDELTVNNE
jgi:hypothetical protein